MSQHFCIVQNCRFPETHLACSHKCRTCGKFGHGFMECGNQLKINNLKNNSKFAGGFGSKPSCL